MSARSTGETAEEIVVVSELFERHAERGERDERDREEGDGRSSSSLMPTTPSRRGARAPAGERA